MPTSRRYVMEVHQTHAEKKNMTVRNGFLLVYFVFAVVPIVAAFDSEGARKAIDDIKQQFATPQAKKTLLALEIFNGAIAMAEKSGYVLNTDVKSAISQCKNLASSGATFFSQIPGQQDIDALEAAYTVYVSGIEKNNNVLIEDLASVQQDSQTALAELTTAIQVVVTAFTHAKSLVGAPLVDDGTPFAGIASTSTTLVSVPVANSSTTLTISTPVHEQVATDVPVNARVISPAPEALSNELKEPDLVNEEHSAADTYHEEDESYSREDYEPISEDGEELHDSEFTAE